MRVSLRWKILLLVVLTPATLGLVTLFTVHRNVTDHVNSSSIHENLAHSVSVFESTLRTRSRELAGVAQVIAQDPRFFSLLMLMPSQRDSRFQSTVAGMAHDFSRITETDLFEVMDRKGRMLASVGTVSSSKAARADLVARALRQTERVDGILIEPTSHYQVVLTPVIADHRVVGLLLLGTRIGSRLAGELRSQMLCEVTFISGTTITGTTLRDRGDRSALLKTLATQDLSPKADLRHRGVIRVNSPRLVYLTLVQRIPVSNPEDLQLYVMQRAFDPETTFLHVMQQDMFKLAVIAIVAALVTGLFFSEQILRPVQRLVRASQAMEKGNYDYPLAIRRRDEIGYLADRFVEMRQRERAYMTSLEQTTKLKSQFLSLASHELRTPISVLKGYRELLADGTLGQVSGPQRKALDAMRDYLVRLTQLAEDAAHYAQVQGERLVLSFAECEVEPIIRRAVGTALAQGAGRAVPVDVKLEPMDRPIEADPEALGNAVVQLLTNAIRFTPDGGRVEVRVLERDERLVIEVEDTGIGISDDKIQAVLSHSLSEVQPNHHRSATGLEFNSFGLGLGLTIARGIVEGHGGTIRATSQPDKGSTFVIHVPIRRMAEAPKAAA